MQAYAVSDTQVRITWLASDAPQVTYEVYRGQSLAGTTPSLDAVDGGLAPAQAYCYSVHAVDEAGRRSPRAGPACVETTDRTPPSRPGAPEVELEPGGSAALAWAPAPDNVGVERYEVLADGEVVGGGPETAATASGLAPGREHCWTVRAVDRAGNVSEESERGCVSVPDVAPPSPPARVSATPGPGEVALSWEAAADDVGVDGYEVFLGDEVAASVSGLAWVERGLPGGEQCFAVRAVDRAGNRSAPSPPACAAVPDTTPPSRPEGLVASAPGETSVVLRWQASRDDVGVAGYEVLRGGNAVARASAPAAGEEGLRAGTEYCYRVRALDAAGNRSEPSEPSCATTPDLTAPETPAGVEAAAASDRAADVSWRPSADNVGVDGYEVLRAGEVVARATGTRARVGGLSPAREACLAVRALDRAGNRSAPSAPACVTPPDLAPPTPPGSPLAAAVTATEVALAWQASTDDVGVAAYEVLRGEAGVARGPGLAAAVRGLEPSAEHCFRVRALDAAGNRSEPSAPACATTPEAGSPAAPTRLEAAAAGARSVSLRWDPSPDPGAVYAVHWEKGQRIGTTRFTTYRVEGLKPGARRCFQVSAIDAAGQSSGLTWPACAEAGGGAAPPPAPAAGRPPAAATGDAPAGTPDDQGEY